MWSGFPGSYLVDGCEDCCIRTVGGWGACQRCPQETYPRSGGGTQALGVKQVFYSTLGHHCRGRVSATLAKAAQSTHFQNVEAPAEQVSQEASVLPRRDGPSS